jgi:lincosamide nucleotidyltransferase B/F
MQPKQYSHLLQRYVAWATSRSDVLGLAAVGSTAATARQPDEWSDHDILIVTSPGAAAAIRADLSWVPGWDRLVLANAETTHGFVLLDETGHLVELAVFDPDELQDVLLEDYAVLLDRGGVGDLLGSLRDATSAQAGDRDATAVRAFALLVKQLVIGLGRHARGERLSAHDRIRGEAVRHLLTLGWCGRPQYPDAIACLPDPFRRVENVQPDLATAILDAVALPLPDAAAALLDLGVRAAEAVGVPTSHAEAAVRTLIDRAVTPRAGAAGGSAP